MLVVRKYCTYLSFLWSPLPVRIAVVHHLSTSRIFDLDSGVAQGTISGPLDVVACFFLNQERFAAALVAIFVDALLDCEIHNRAGGNLGCYKHAFFRMCPGSCKGEVNIHFMVNFMKLVMARPAVKMDCGVGMYILDGFAKES